MSTTTDITIVLDRSGSMEPIAKSTIKGFNAFLEEQKALEGRALISLAQFDDQYEPLYEGIDIREARSLDRQTYVPRGMTALLDAIGKTVRTTSKRLKTVPEGEEPPKAIFVIITDGLENYSREYTRDKIFRMIRKREEKGWQFVFLGANQDAIHEAGRIGIKADRAMSFRPDDQGVINFMKGFSENISEVRMHDTAFMFKKKQRKEQEEK